MNVEAYLRRIGYSGSLQPDGQVLQQLHLCHMQTVPFENLDIHLGRPIILSYPSLYQKIVEERRGGFCYELNGLFGWLLSELGFKVEMLSARVYGADGPGMEFDHMLLRVHDHFLVDVGFGDSFVLPIPLGYEEQQQRLDCYRLISAGDDWILQRRKPGEDWQPSYIFTLIPRKLAEYEAMCRYQQTSPNSSFTRKTVCSRATEYGRVTLSNGRLIITEGAEKQESPIPNEASYRQLLRTHFNTSLPHELSLARLLQPLP